MESGESSGGARVNVLRDGVAQDIWKFRRLRDEDEVLADFVRAVEALEVDLGGATAGVCCSVCWEVYVCEEFEEDVDACVGEELQGFVGGLADVCVVDGEGVDAEAEQVGDVFAEFGEPGGAEGVDVGFWTPGAVGGVVSWGVC